MARAPIEMPHLPWRLTDDSMPYILFGQNGPSFGPVTFAGTHGDVMRIARIIIRLPHLVAAAERVVVQNDSFQVAIQHLPNGRLDDGLSEAIGQLATVLAPLRGGAQ